ncbi:unnamed protein product [Rotaria socialis]|uniref:fructokinase n=1 Tax=Rotaria socialis TaxID=392032 RepID=A0A820NJA5_9BILA|nr:unnamed protein product [Rotaria socialis]CAF3414216.1 unnamed protein product [Rotaria socialis]CAF4389882.1 unnamed protein product [Rotaria socialis]CAF4460854.1 unnamed protein product [Rotaria socialis]
MSSLVIGLDINDSQITSALVRIEPLTCKRLSIERDTYFTRSFDINPDSNPRNIISVWIQCINDAILDFVDHYKEFDNIVGISIGMSGPMDYESGICYIQSPKFNKFFGLNIRLSLQNGLKNLVAHWKHDYYDRYHTESTAASPRKQTILDGLRLQPPKSTTITSPGTPRTPILVNLAPLSLGKALQYKSLRTNFLDYCGRQDDDYDLSDENKGCSSICRSRRDTYFHDIEMTSSAQFPAANYFNPRLWTILEQIVHLPISFYNSTVCFGLGEANDVCNQHYERIIALTLSSSFSSAFIDRGEIIINRKDVPLDGTLSKCPYDQHSIADDWFSTRGLLRIYKKILTHESSDDSSDTSSTTLSIDERQQNENDSLDIEHVLAHQASNGDPIAVKTFEIFAHLLGQFLIPYINAFHTQLIVIGGNLAEVWYLLENQLNCTIKKYSQAQTYFSLSQGKSICFGAVQQLSSENSKSSFRKTHQYLLPVTKNIDTSQYDIYPTHQIPSGDIGSGYQQLNEKLCNLIEKNDILLIDGFVGTYFNEYAHQLNKYYSQNKLSSLLFYDSRTFLQTDSNLDREFHLKHPKSLFGKLASGLDFKKDFIDSKKFEFFKNNLSYPCVIIGPGSSYVNETSPLVYIDLAKNELYYRIATETACSYLKPTRRLKSDDSELTSAVFEQKCLYFLDYPVFNKLKQELLPRINYFIDGQRPNCPTWIDGSTFRQALAHIANQPIRVRPWFEPGPWGGQWLKTVCKNISQHAKNYAWSFEMITSENGLLLSDVNNHLLELSWDLFYGSQVSKILGNDIHRQLFSNANDFPIRFDFLDTIDGGNLSIQCNPSLAYIRTHFGEKITQDEAYYIVETKQHWQQASANDATSSSYIYLGFHENIDHEEFHQALVHSDRRKQEINIENYVQRIPTNVHDFFLIPNQTIHAAGRNQVVLEISARPHIYTFKLYDWLRLGLDGHPRLLNIEHGMENLKFDRHGEQLRCQPVSLKIEQDQYEEQHLPTHDLHFYDVQRLIIEPNENIQIIRSTENRFHLCMLVEGDAIEIQFDSHDNNQEKQTRQYNYIETFLIPASINEYCLRPIINNNNHNKDTRPQKFTLLIAFLKWDCEKILE